MAETLTKFKGKNALFVWFKLNNFLKNQYLPKYFSQTKLRVWFFSDFFGCGGGSKRGKPAIFATFGYNGWNYAKTRYFTPIFCTCPTPSAQNIAIPATQKLTDCVSKPTGYLPSHLRTNPPKNAPRHIKIDLLINQWLTK